MSVDHAHALSHPDCQSPKQLSTCRFFIMPRDLKEFHTDVLQHPERLYIQKPVASSRGRGVRMVKASPMPVPV